MNLLETFPLIYCMNLGRRQDRRVRCEEQFEAHGLPVRRFPAVDARYLKRKRGFRDVGRYAHALTTRLIIRRAILAKAEAVLVFEDDVILHPDLNARLAKIDLPQDWEIFYLGCQHQVRPTPVCRGLVRVNGALDTHAWGIRACVFRRLLRTLKGTDYRPHATLPPADVFLAEIHRTVRAYAVFPNLAWQHEEHSDLCGGLFGNYATDGTQRTAEDAIAGSLAEALDGRAYPVAKIKAAEHVPVYLEQAWLATFGAQLQNCPSQRRPFQRRLGEAPEPLAATGKVAFLFLTRGILHQPAVWQEYWGALPGRASVYAHSSSLDAVRGTYLEEVQISERYDTKWADISLVRGQLALLRYALQEPENQFFMFASESCVPIRPLEDLILTLALDGRSRFDWQSWQQVQKSSPTKARRALPLPEVPASYCCFHPQWVLLNREAAQLVEEDDFTDSFVGMFAPDESYTGTVLRIKGYPLENKVLKRNMTFTKWLRQGDRHPETFDSVSAVLAAEFIESGHFFARKFATTSNIRESRLHMAEQSRKDVPEASALRNTTDLVVAPSISPGAPERPTTMFRTGQSPVTVVALRACDALTNKVQRAPWHYAEVTDARDSAFAVRTYLEQRDVRSLLSTVLSSRRVGSGVEIGAGYGRMTLVLSEFCDHVFAFEREPHFVEEASALIPRAQFTEVQSLEHLPSADAQFDVALIFTVLQHLADSVAYNVGREISRILRPGGVLICCEETDTALLTGEISAPCGIFTIGRPVVTYEEIFYDFVLQNTKKRKIEPTNTRADVGTYMVFTKSFA